jgi:hypothetical protein
MPSLWRHPNSRFWTACYTDKDGRRVKKSTKQTERKKAMVIAVEWERVEARARKATVSTRQIQKVLNELLEKTNEETIVTPSTQKYLDDWLTSIETKKSGGTYERYKHTVELFLKHIGAAARSPVTSITSSHIENFLNARLKESVAPKTAVVDKKYTLKSLPDEMFSGLHLMCLMYAGFKRVTPEHDLQMDLNESFLIALEMFQKGETS